MTTAANVKQTIATLKGIEAQLSKFAIQSDEESAKRIFHESMLSIEEISQDIKDRLIKMEKEEPEYTSN
jgi:phosphoribosyl-dephospho-CoA transferase